MEQITLRNNLVTKKGLVSTLLLLGSPIWLSLLLVGGVILGSLYLLVWLTVFSVGILSFSAVIAGLVSIIGAVFNQDVFYLMTQMGIGLALIGIGGVLADLASFLTKKAQLVLKIMKREKRYYHGK